jgi:hypothetical protein
VVFEHAFIMNEMRGGQNIILEPEVAGWSIEFGWQWPTGVTYTAFFSSVQKYQH